MSCTPLSAQPHSMIATDICIAPYSQKLTTKALWYGSHNVYTANTPYLPLPRKLARWRHH